MSHVTHFNESCQQGMPGASAISPSLDWRLPDSVLEAGVCLYICMMNMTFYTGILVCMHICVYMCDHVYDHTRICVYIYARMYICTY